MRKVAAGVILALAATAAQAGDAVLLASRRSGWIEAFRLDNLETAARVRVKEKIEGVESSPDGQRMFIRMPHPQAAEVCCALWALDTRNLRAFAILWPAFSGVVAGGKVFEQRADEGIEVFDARSLAHYPTIRAPGVYNLTASPDGRWLYGTRQFPSPGLDIFDLGPVKMTAEVPVPGASLLRGVWLGQRYWLFAPGLPGAGQLWGIDPEKPVLGQPKLVRLPDAGCPEPAYELAAVADRIAIYSPGGSCMTGYVLADPGAGSAERKAGELRLSRLLASQDGKTLYGIATPDVENKTPRLLKLEASTGKILASRPLAVDAWTLTLGMIPGDWENHTDLQAVFQ